MERRDYLKVAGAGGLAALGAYGAYTTVIRDAWMAPPGPGDDGTVAELEDDELPRDDQDEVEYETRDGWMLSGITPSTRDLTVLDPLEAWLGNQHAVVGYFMDIGQPDHAEIHRLTHGLFDAAWERGQVPHVFWQPFLPDRDGTSDEINREIAAGEWDEDIQAWADGIASWLYDPEDAHRRLYINLAPEFNGDWSPWSPALGDDDEADFVEMWQRVHDIFEETGIDEHFVQWVWTLDNTTRGVDREACYPGDEYVDWCGIHGYNWASWTGWQDPSDVYDGTIGFIEQLTDKPIAITEFASSSETDDGGHDPAAKNEWLVEAYEYLEHNDVRMSIYFDLSKETDWAIFDGEYGYTTTAIDDREFNVYPAYRDAMVNDGVLGPHPDHPRLLTDDEFAGNF